MLTARGDDEGFFNLRAVRQVHRGHSVAAWDRGASEEREAKLARLLHHTVGLLPVVAEVLVVEDGHAPPVGAEDVAHGAEELVAWVHYLVVLGILVSSVLPHDQDCIDGETTPAAAQCFANGGVLHKLRELGGADRREVDRALSRRVDEN